MNLSTAEARALSRLASGRNSGVRQSKTLKNLAEKGLISGTRQEGFSLTDAGRAKAKELQKEHR